MKESTKNAFRKLAVLTGTKCGTCAPASAAPYRCCDAIFCEATADELVAAGEALPNAPNIRGMMFMGEHGCVLSPEQRQFCTSYVCPKHLQDRVFRRDYQRLISKINRDPDVKPIRGVGNL
jgi:hypothetical protein